MGLISDHCFHIYVAVSQFRISRYRVPKFEFHDYYNSGSHSLPLFFHCIYSFVNYSFTHILFSQIHN